MIGRPARLETRVLEATRRGDYLLNFRSIFGTRPLLVTRMSVEIDQELPRPGLLLDPAERHPLPFLRRLLQLCYWLDAQVMVYPEVLFTVQIDAAGMAKAKDPDHPALGTWDDVIRWKHVPRLSATMKGGGAGYEDEPDPEAEADPKDESRKPKVEPDPKDEKPKS